MRMFRAWDLCWEVLEGHSHFARTVGRIIMEKLKPCPFCGGKPKILRNSYTGWYRIVCGCGCLRKIERSWGKKKTITKYWNSRPTKPPPLQRTERS